MNPTKFSILICIGIFCILVLFPCAGFGDQASTVDLEEILRIKDTGDTFYFEFPNSPVIDTDGFLYVLDNKQLLKFDKSGTFIGNYGKNGLGPGEANYPQDVFIQEDFFVLYNINPHKFLFFDRKNGTLKNEVRLSNNLAFSRFVTYYNNKHFFFSESIPSNTKNKAVILDIKVNLLSYNLEESKFKDEGLFYLKKYFVSKSETRSSVKNVHFVQQCVLDDHTVFIANNGKYEIQCLDLKEMKIFPFIKRAYKAVSMKDEWKKHFHTFRFAHDGPNGIEYKSWMEIELDDIQKLFTVGEKIWVMTSTFNDKTRLVNIDVFDLGGTYINSFSLKVPVRVLIYRLNIVQMKIDNDRLFIFERNEDEDYELAGYKLKNVPAWAR